MAFSYIHVHVHRKKNPCGGNEDCVKSYAFQNHLSLNNNIRNLSVGLYMYIHICYHMHIYIYIVY